jgi:hypothetical protein
VSIPFPSNSLNLLLLNRVNSSGISLVGIMAISVGKKKWLKENRTQVYRNDTRVLLIMKKEITSSVTPTFLSLSKKGYCQLSVSYSVFQIGLILN